MDNRLHAISSWTQTALLREEINRPDIRARSHRASSNEVGISYRLFPYNYGALQVLVDCVESNAVAMRDSYAIPRMDDSIDFFGDAKIFSTVDANSGWWQVEMAKGYNARTAFVSHHG